MTGYEPRRRAEAQPRYGRIAAFSSAVLVTCAAVLGGIGLLPTSAPAAAQSPGPTASGRGAMTLSSQEQTPPQTRTQSQPTAPAPTDATTSTAAEGPAGPYPVPADSGSGRRIVFDQSDQRVWLVDRDGTVARTYPVSGSVTDNLQPGSYQVYSKSQHAVGIDGSTMDLMVRFAHGDNAAIGFHDIPDFDGRRVQTKAQLGVARSHGCIRQWHPDAKALWDFAPVGTDVVVTA